jgi:3-oxoacyl-[acyl-carrier protein] reductase
MKIADSKTIVTGAGSGMGRHFALRLAELGGSVVASDVNADALAEVAGAAAGLPGRLTTRVADVSKEGDVIALIDGSADAMGGLNALVNNAGIFRDGLLVKVDRDRGKVAGSMSLKNWQAVIDVDLTGPFLCTREFARSCIDRGEKQGVIVAISSVSKNGNPGQSNYSAAKAGLVADTKLWSIELAKYGIRTGAIAPGFIRTPILDGMRPDVLEKMVSGVPLRRVGEAEEIFLGLKFILECDYFTGRCLEIDGGLVV